eukprot:CAMPEP_0196717186 /NCGR_PEP_ID=MMETSP1091-20130531/607_1 /TAXON_ID=302021 /ORGANISM="Rhodomonas sp., Strain CCMP768" /LENGTH=154 /DNA_ID=CAMNT_0042057439 /DNA_START=16 /DNA_END=480 /DNA_ORIENTATION=+
MAACFLALLLLAIIDISSAVPLTTLSSPSTWSDCGGGATTLEVTNVIVSPDPVKSGQNFTLAVECTSAGSITTGDLTSKVYLAGIKVHTETDPLCEKTTCPISAGPAKIKTTSFMPSVTPPGWYEVRLSGADQDELPAICADIHFSVVIGDAPE